MQNINNGNQADIKYWNSIKGDLIDFKKMLSIERKKFVERNKNILNDNEKNKFINHLLKRFNEEITKNDLFSIFNESYNIIKNNSIFNIKWEFVNILFKFYSFESEHFKNKDEFTKVEVTNIYDKNSLLYIDNTKLTNNNKFTHYIEIPLNVKTTKNKDEFVFNLNLKEFQLNKKDFIDISVIVNNKEYFMKNGSIYQDTLKNFKDCLDKNGRINNGYFEIVFVKNILYLRILNNN